MIEQTPPQYRSGQRVVCGLDLFNDGSFPGAEAEALLVSAGTEGEVVQIGTHAESGTHIYMVEFSGGQVIGCFENEIMPPDVWRQQVALTEVGS